MNIYREVERCDIEENKIQFNKGMAVAKIFISSDQFYSHHSNPSENKEWVKLCDWGKRGYSYQMIMDSVNKST